MTAITHVVNYTVQCPHYEVGTPVTWRDHIEVNQSCEIALRRIQKWHQESGCAIFTHQELTVRKANKEQAYFAMLTNRIKNDGHVLATFKIFLDERDVDTSVEEIVRHLHDDYQTRLTKLA